MAEGLVCWNCGRALDDVPLPISRHATCADCFNSLHSCRMCGYFATSRPGQCDHDLADPPLIKENANFCEWFRPATGRFRSDSKKNQDHAKDKFAALFGDGSSDPASEDTPDTTDPNDPRKRLDDLFKD